MIRSTKPKCFATFAVVAAIDVMNGKVVCAIRIMATVRVLVNGREHSIRTFLAVVPAAGWNPLRHAIEWNVELGRLDPR